MWITKSEGEAPAEPEFTRELLLGSFGESQSNRSLARDFD